ncbi:MAG TPA: hypothetical protein VMZ53_11270 [Kofleriaceae bacterium]|nr:hypothetical protein [Kofleriaceae bacterium]
MRRFLLAALVAGSGACAQDTSPCSEAAAQLTACSDDQRAAFVSACEETGGADPASLLADDSSAACKAVPSDGKADQATLAATGLCVASMYGVKWTVTALSPTAQPLSAQTKTMLRPLYGSLVDEARVSIGAALPPAIKIAGHVLAVEPAAMTFGSSIFILQEVADSKSADRLLLTTVHELAHAKQAKTAGGYYNFAVSYCRDMIAVGFDYSHIHLEEAAYAVQDQARSSLQTCGHVTCP